MAETFEGTVTVNEGVSEIKDRAGGSTIILRGEIGDIDVGGFGANGNIRVRDQSGSANIQLAGLTGTVQVGPPPSASGDIFVGGESIHLSGEDGSITLRGEVILRDADCSEDFDLAEEQPTPGSVLVIGEEGRLRPSDRSYDLPPSVGDLDRHRPRQRREDC